MCDPPSLSWPAYKVSNHYHIHNKGTLSLDLLPNTHRQLNHSRTLASIYASADSLFCFLAASCAGLSLLSFPSSSQSCAQLAKQCFVTRTGASIFFSFWAEVPLSLSRSLVYLFLCLPLSSLIRSRSEG